MPLTEREGEGGCRRYSAIPDNAAALSACHLDLFSHTCAHFLPHDAIVPQSWATHCCYHSIKGGRGEREEVSLILRGNWSLPTMHMGHTPYMGWVPFQWWVGGGRLAEADPPLKWDKIPILLVGGRRKRRRRRLTHHSNGIQSHFTGGWLAEGYNSCGS